MREQPSYLVWRDLTVVIPNIAHGHTKILLQGTSRFAELGRFMAIMGPSGSWKSTFLDSLAVAGVYLAERLNSVLGYISRERERERGRKSRLQHRGNPTRLR